MQSITRSDTANSRYGYIWLWHKAPAVTMVCIVLFAFGLRILTLFHYGLHHLSLNSDDEGYTNSAIHLLQYGRITYHSIYEHSVHMMPGITFLLAAIFAVFGWHTVGLYAAKLVMILIGTVGVYATYLLGREAWNTWAGVIAAACTAIYIPIILTDNLLLTETPFMTSSLLLLYFSIRHARERRRRDFAGMVITYLIALMFRPTIALFPVLIVGYHLLKRFPVRSLAVRTGLWVVIICIVLCPWWIRNYHYYHKFIPLTAGTGDPMLLGTYQGEGYPKTPTYDEITLNIRQEHPGLSAYDMSMDEQAAAKERLSEWWHTNPRSLVKSFLYLKPQKLWNDTFYWVNIFHLKSSTVHAWRPGIVSAGMWGYLIGLLLCWKKKRELLLIWAALAYYTVLYSIYFVFGRYSQPLLPLIFLGSGIGLTAIFQTVTRGIRWWMHNRNLQAAK